MFIAVDDRIEGMRGRLGKEETEYGCLTSSTSESLTGPSIFGDETSKLAHPGTGERDPAMGNGAGEVLPGRGSGRNVWDMFLPPRGSVQT